MRRTWNR